MLSAREVYTHPVVLMMLRWIALIIICRAFLLPVKITHPLDLRVIKDALLHTLTGKTLNEFPHQNAGQNKTLEPAWTAASVHACGSWLRSIWIGRDPNGTSCPEENSETLSWSKGAWWDLPGEVKLTPRMIVLFSTLSGCLLAPYILKPAGLPHIPASITK